MAATFDPSKTPAMPAPPGQTTNFVDPEFIGGRVWITNGVFLALTFTFLSLRLYTRLCMTPRASYDDVLLVFGMLFSVAQSITSVLQIQHGLGLHLWDVPISTLTPAFLKLNYIGSLFYSFAMFSTKMSMLFFYLRINPSRWWRIAVFILMFCVSSYFVGGVISLFVECIPLQATWDLTITNATCINLPALSISTAGLNVAIDFAMLILPMPTVWKLRVPTRQKIALTCIFGIGAFVCGVSIARVIEFIPLLASPDVSWTTTNAYVWCVIEINTGIICASLVTLRPFLRQFFPRLIGHTDSGFTPNRDTPGSGTRKMSSRSFGWPRHRENNLYPLSGIDDDELFDDVNGQIGLGLRSQTTILRDGANTSSTRGDGLGDVESGLSERSTELITPPLHASKHGTLMTTDLLVQELNTHEKGKEGF
ncbi:MAG: hypothetical protein M4579_004736 [Chaenotheca gracillima]|nr:MAG: hypothetical protein M4579_004736 [Chaenotheca gracillima]